MRTYINVSWWNSNLKELRKKVRKLERKAFCERLKAPDKREETELAMNNYKKTLTEYNKYISKCKKNSWRKFCEDISNESEKGGRKR